MPVDERAEPEHSDDADSSAATQVGWGAVLVVAGLIVFIATGADRLGRIVILIGAINLLWPVLRAFGRGAANGARDAGR